MGWENSATGGSEEKSFYKNDHKYVVGIYYVDNSGDYIVMAEAENASGDKSLQELRNVMIISLVIALGICIVLGEWFSYLCLKPIKRINHRMEKIQASSLDYRIPVEKEVKMKLRFLALQLMIFYKDFKTHLKASNHLFPMLPTN